MEDSATIERFKARINGRFALLEAEREGLRKRVHQLDGHNQHFERCESRWCHPSRDENPAIGFASDPTFLDADRDTLKAERDRLAGYIEKAEDSIFRAMSHSGWGRSTYEHHASRVTSLCNLYLGSVHTIAQFDEKCSRLETENTDLLEACGYCLKLLKDMGHGGLAGAILAENAIASANRSRS